MNSMQVILHLSDKKTHTQLFSFKLEPYEGLT